MADPDCDLTISIATYDRPGLLAKTLQCCIDQTNQCGLRYEILVTDNHPSGNGRATVTQMAAASSVPIRYQVETARNMSVLRNAGIKAARGRLLAIIDDDELCGPDWLDALVGCMRRTGADIVTGPRLAIFAAGAPPAYDPHCRLFARDLRLPPDAPIALVRADGKPLYGLGTGNSLFDVARCFADAEPFDLAFGNAGGEDAEIFMRLYLQGRRFAWAADAVATETVPPHRTAIAYRLIRIRRETQIYVSLYLHFTRDKRRVWLELMAKGVVQWLAGATIAVLTREYNSDKSLRGRFMMTQGAAKLQWRQPVGYIDEPASV